MNLKEKEEFGATYNKWYRTALRLQSVTVGPIVAIIY